jgi:Leucine-rich repeat (LRR) protein
MLPNLKLLSGVLLAVAMAGCTRESNEEKAGPLGHADVQPASKHGQGGRAALDEKQAKAIAQIERLGGKVQVEENSPDSPVYSIDFSNAKISDEALQNLDSLPRLKVLILSGTKVTDAGLAHLEGLGLLTGLMLDGTRVTNAGLEHVRGLRSLEELLLDGTKVTDTGLQRLDGLTSLQRLGLAGTRVTDAGLKHLKGLTGLRGISLLRTKVTDAGVKDLRQALPGANISH